MHRVGQLVQTQYMMATTIDAVDTTLTTNGTADIDRIRENSVAMQTDVESKLSKERVTKVRGLTQCSGSRINRRRKSGLNDSITFLQNLEIKKKTAREDEAVAKQ